MMPCRLVGSISPAHLRGFESCFGGCAALIHPTDMLSIEEELKTELQRTGTGDGTTGVKTGGGK